MKAPKRKRSAKARPVVETAGADVVVAEVPAAAEPVVEQMVEPVAESSPAAVEALVAEPAADAGIEQTAAVVVDVSIEQAVEMSAETPVEQVAEVVAEAAAEPVAAAAETAEPIVVLGANCSVKDAAALKTSLCALSNRSDAVTVDVSAVERVDTATMQLLCAFVRDRSGRSQSVTWRGESAALQDAVRLLGVGVLLGLEKGVAA